MEGTFEVLLRRYRELTEENEHLRTLLRSKHQKLRFECNLCDFSSPDFLSLVDHRNVEAAAIQSLKKELGLE